MVASVPNRHDPFEKISLTMPPSPDGTDWPFIETWIARPLSDTVAEIRSVPARWSGPAYGDIVEYQRTGEDCGMLVVSLIDGVLSTNVLKAVSLVAAVEYFCPGEKFRRATEGTSQEAIDARRQEDEANIRYRIPLEQLVAARGWAGPTWSSHEAAQIAVPLGIDRASLRNDLMSLPHVRAIWIGRVRMLA